MQKNSTNGKIFIVDDDESILKSLNRYFSSKDFEVLTYTNAADYIQDLDGHDVCLISDISMDEMDGLELQRHLNDKGSLRPIIFITAHGTVDKTKSALRHGAFDFIEKPFQPGDLLEKAEKAIEESKEIIQIFNRFETLTKKEKQIFEHVVKGLKNKEIGEVQFVSIATVETHRSRVMTKMNADSLPDLVKMSVQIHAII